MDNTNSRDSRSAGVSVRTTMLLLAGSVHDACIVRKPSTSTTHRRQLPYGFNAGWWHSRGMRTLILSAASRTVVPSGTSTF